MLLPLVKQSPVRPFTSNAGSWFHRLVVSSLVTFSQLQCILRSSKHVPAPLRTLPFQRHTHVFVRSKQHRAHAACIGTAFEFGQLLPAVTPQANVCPEYDISTASVSPCVNRTHNTAAESITPFYSALGQQLSQSQQQLIKDACWSGVVSTTALTHVLHVEQVLLAT